MDILSYDINIPVNYLIQESFYMNMFKCLVSVLTLIHTTHTGILLFISSIGHEISHNIA